MELNQMATTQFSGPLALGNQEPTPTVIIWTHDDTTPPAAAATLQNSHMDKRPVAVGHLLALSNGTIYRCTNATDQNNLVWQAITGNTPAVGGNFPLDIFNINGGTTAGNEAVDLSALLSTLTGWALCRLQLTEHNSAGGTAAYQFRNETAGHVYLEYEVATGATTDITQAWVYVNAGEINLSYTTAGTSPDTSGTIEVYFFIPTT